MLPVRASRHRHTGPELLAGPAAEHKNANPGVCAVSVQREEQTGEERSYSASSPNG